MKICVVAVAVAALAAAVAAQGSGRPVAVFPDEFVVNTTISLQYAGPISLPG